MAGFSFSVGVVWLFGIDVRRRVKYAVRPDRTSLFAVSGATAARYFTDTMTRLRNSGSWLSIARWRYAEPSCVLKHGPQLALGHTE